MKKDKDEVERDAFIQAVKRMVLKYQRKDFERWHHWNKKLEELDPYNPLLEVGFNGLPYFGGFKD